MQQAGARKDRGREVTRIEAFVDAAFAFAVTLLVISFNALPDSAEALLQALKGVPAFAASFALLAMLWWTHADWSRRYGLDDGRSVLLSLLLVFLVLVYVYPLRIIFTAFFGWISHGWLPVGIAIDSTRDLQLLYTVGEELANSTRWPGCCSPPMPWRGPRSGSSWWPCTGMHGGCATPSASTLRNASTCGARSPRNG